MDSGSNVESENKGPLIGGYGHTSPEDFSGYIFMCNGKTKPECYRYRVFGLPAGRWDQVIERIKPGIKLFLYDYSVKYLYGVYEATTAGHMNLETAAFDGYFPAQVRFHIYKECLPLPESRFKHAIQDNYQKGSKKFNPILNSQQVNSLLSMFDPLPASSSAAELPSPGYKYSGLTSSHAPQAPGRPGYTSINSRLNSQVLKPQFNQTSVMHQQHVGYGYAARKGDTYPAVQLQSKSSQNSLYPAGAAQRYFLEEPRSYESYHKAAAQHMVRTNQQSGLSYGYYQLPTQTPTQETAAQHHNTIPPRQQAGLNYEYSQLPSQTQTHMQMQENKANQHHNTVPVHQQTGLKYEYNQLSSQMLPQTQMPIQENTGQYHDMVPIHPQTGLRYEYNQLPSQTLRQTQENAAQHHCMAPTHQETGYNQLPSQAQTQMQENAARYHNMVPTHQQTGLRYEYNQLPSQTQTQMPVNAAQYHNMAPTPQQTGLGYKYNQLQTQTQTQTQMQVNAAQYHSMAPTHQQTGLGYEYNQLPQTHTQMQENAAQHHSMVPTHPQTGLGYEYNQLPSQTETQTQMQQNVTQQHTMVPTHQHSGLGYEYNCSTA